MAGECDERGRDERLVVGMEFYDGGGSALCAGVGVADERGERGFDEPDVELECIERGEYVSGSGIDEFEFWDDGV